MQVLDSLVVVVFGDFDILPSAGPTDSIESLSEEGPFFEVFCFSHLRLDLPQLILLVNKVYDKVEESLPEEGSRRG